MLLNTESQVSILNLGSGMTLYPEWMGGIKCVSIYLGVSKAGRRRRCGKFRWKMKAANFSSMTFLSITLLSLATVGSSVV